MSARDPSAPSNWVNEILSTFSLYGNYMILMCIAYILPYFAAAVVMMQFMNLAQLAKERFQTINQ